MRPRVRDRWSPELGGPEDLASFLGSRGVSRNESLRGVRNGGGGGGDCKQLVLPLQIPAGCWCGQVPRRRGHPRIASAAATAASAPGSLPSGHGAGGGAGERRGCPSEVPPLTFISRARCLGMDATGSALGRNSRTWLRQRQTKIPGIVASLASHPPPPTPCASPQADTPAL